MGWGVMRAFWTEEASLGLSFPKEGKHRVCVCVCVYELCGWHSKQEREGSGTRDGGGGRQDWIRET